MAIGLMVPLSVLLALVILQALDVTINVLSLGGLASRRRPAGRQRHRRGRAAGGEMRNRNGSSESADVRRARQATIEATQEVAGPLIAGTLTTLLVFGPIIFVRGLAAALFRDLSLSVVTSVGASLMLALTLMPVMIVGQCAAASKNSSTRQSNADSRTRPAACTRSAPAVRRIPAPSCTSGA